MALALGTTQAKHSGKAGISAVPTARTGIPVWEGWSQLKRLDQQAGERVQLQANSKCSAQPHGLVAKSPTPWGQPTSQIQHGESDLPHVETPWINT